VHPITRLPLEPSRRKGTISRFEYDNEYTFQHFVPVQSKRPKQGMWAFFMGWMPKEGNPIQLNGAFHVSTTIMRFVIASAAEAKLSALYHNRQTGIIFQLT
jgi:hypothetical protein